MSGEKRSKWEVDAANKRHLEGMRERRLEAENQRKLEKARLIEESQKQRQLEKTELRNEMERQKRSEDAKLQMMAKSVSDSVKQLSKFKSEIVAETGNILNRFDEDQIHRMPSLLAIQASRNHVLARVDVFLKAQSGSSASVAGEDALNQVHGLIDELNQVRQTIRQYAPSSTHLKEHLRQLDAEQDFTEDLKNSTVKPKKAFNLGLFLKDEGRPTEGLRLSAIVSEFEGTISAYLTSDLLSDKQKLEILAIQNAVNEILNDTQLDDGYKYCQIEMRQKGFLLSKAQYDQAILETHKIVSENESLRLDYISLCSILKIPPTQELQSLNVEDTDSLTIRLRAETKRLKNVWAHRDEAEYIAQSVNDVMKEMGYDLIATDLMSMSQQEHCFHHIYGLDDGNAVSIFSSDSGSLLFEVTGISSQEREPSSLEKLKIKESMETFRQKYGIVRTKLKERGIDLKKEHVKLPNQNLARIIGVGNDKARKTQSAERRRIGERASERGKAHE